nr:hypothetical protein [Tanacetum cinerariifolium]
MEESAEEESEVEKHDDDIGIKIESENEEEMVKKQRGGKCIKRKEPSTSKKKTTNNAEKERKITQIQKMKISLIRPAMRRWNTPMMRKRITMETSKGCLGNLDHHEDFDPDKDQNGIDLYKGLDVYIEPLSERKQVTKEEFYQKIIDRLL